ncbi:MAG: hypothetical protein H0W72_00440 [Planctomycetes bacterium]|nr:hypothetical protein [Planctomycetota bacterium]
MSTASASFAPGAVNATVSVDPLDDATDEENESVTLTLSGPGNATLGATTVHTVTITDDDAPPTVSLSTLTPTRSEGAGTATVTATLSAVSGRDVTVNYLVSGTATVGSDVTVAPAVVSILAGATTGSITIAITDDALSEVDETVQIDLGALVNATAGTATVVVTITDNETLPQVAFATTGAPSAESAGTVLITVTQSATSAQPTTVSYLVGGTAVAADYALTPGVFVIPAGALSADFSLAISDDLRDENAESVVITLTGTTANAQLAAVGLVHTVTITDNDDPPTVDWSAASQNVSESGVAVAATAQLSAASGLDITIPIVVSGSAAAGDRTVSTTTLTILAGATFGIVNVTPLADPLDEDDETVVLTIDPPTNAGLGSTTVHSVTILDDDDAPTVVFSAASANRAENGAAIAVNVTLSAASGRTVTVPYAVSGTASAADYTIAAPGASPLVFAVGETSKAVTATPIDDALAEGDETVVLTLGTPANATVGAPAIYTLTIQDNEAALAVQFAAASSSAAESAGAVIVAVTLSAPAAVDVTVDFTVGGTAAVPADVAVSGSPLVIPAGATGGSITVTISNDQIAEAAETVALTIGVTSSTAVGSPSLHTLTITDDDVPGVTINEAGGIVLAEGGAADTYTVVLDRQPSAAVDITMSGGGQVAVLPITLTFDAGNWNIAQTVTVTAVDDAVAEGAHGQAITHTVTGGGVYAGTAVANVTAAISDNDVVEVVVAHAGAIAVSEGGAGEPITVALASQPTANITLTLSGGAQVTTAPVTLTFTALDWNTPQSVTVLAVDDAIDEASPHLGALSFSAVGGNYTGAPLSASSVQITDNDSAGVTVLPASGLSTTESGGLTVFVVFLTSQPTGTVEIDLQSSLTTEGTVSPASLSFSAANWFVPRLVFVTGENDDVDDGDIAYAIITSIDTIVTADANYDVQAVADVSVTNIDNDAAGVTVTVAGSTSLDEADVSATFTYTAVLNSEPTGPVVVAPVVDGQTAVTPASLSFNSGDWSTPKTFTVAAVNDSVDEPNPHTGVISHTVSGPGYNGLPVASVSASIADDDVRGVALSTLGILTVQETGTTALFDVRLDSQPLTNVTVDVSSSDLGEGSVSPAILTFTPSNWNVVQDVQLRGIDDELDDGTVAWTVLTGASSSDSNYGGLGVSDVSAETEDDDLAGIAVSTTAVIVAETVTSAVFTVVLNSEPEVDVQIDLQSTDTGEASVSPNTITFSPSNWNVPRNITVTGVDDDIDDGDQSPDILTLAAISGDSDYSGRNAADVDVTVQDEDVRGVTIAQSGGFTQVSEAGTSDSYTVVLDTEPTGSVLVSVTSDAQSTVLPLSLTFTTANWNLPQAVVVNAVNDTVAEGAHASVIAHASSGGDYGGALAIESVDAIIVDNDTAAVVATPLAGLTTSEAATTASFNLTLGSQPTADVTIDLTSDDTTAGTVSPASVVFTSGNWSIPVAVTITGVDDVPDAVNAAVVYHVLAEVDAINTLDPTYDVLSGSPTQVTLSNLDDDTAAILLSLTPPGTTSEGTPPGTAILSVVLSSRPTVNVQVSVVSTDMGEVTVPVTVLTFTPGTWDTAQSLTLTGVDDPADDSDVVVELTATANALGEANYNGVTEDIDVTNLDDDTAAVVVAPLAGLTTTEIGGTASFTVVLSSQPLGGASVTIPVSSSNSGQGTVSPASLTFLSSDWDQAQTVTITGADANSTHDGNVGYTIILGAATSGDAQYNLYNPSDVSVTNLAVNNQPGLGALVDLTVLEDTSVDQIVNLTGISSGQAGESQVLTVTATSGATAIVPNPTVSYTSPLPSGSIAFRPTANAFGSATITVTVTDDAGLGPAAATRSQLFGVTVTPVNDAPQFTKGLDLVLAEDAGAQTMANWATAIAAGPANELGQTLSFACTSDNAGLFSVAPAIDVGGTLTFTPAANTAGTATVTVTLSDNGGVANGGVDATAATFTITVDSVNDDPAFTPIADLVVTEDPGLQQVTITGVTPGPNEAAQVLSFSATSSDLSLIPSVTVDYVAGSTTAVVEFEPSLDQSGVCTITVTATDNGTLPEGGTRSYVDTFQVTVNPVNDAPVVVVNTGITVVLRGDLAIDEVGPVVTRLQATDVDSLPASLVYNLTLPPGQGSLYIDTGATAGLLDAGDTVLVIGDPFAQTDLLAGLVRYAHGGSGSSDGFAFTVSDGAATSGLNVFQITIDRSPPDVVLDPLAVGDLTYTEGTPAIRIAPSGTVDDSDSPVFDGGTFTVSFASVAIASDQFNIDVTGLVTLGGSVVEHSGLPIGTLSSLPPSSSIVVNLSGINATPARVEDLLKSITYRCTSDIPGTTPRVVQVVISDGDGDTSAAVTRTIQVVPVNDQPAVIDLTVVTPENVTATALIPASDADLDTLTWSVPGISQLNGPTRGNASISATGVLTYIPLPGQSGSDTFLVTADDGSGALNSSDTATITVVITGNSDPRPWITSDPPMEIQDGDVVIYNITVDSSEIVGAVPTLAFTLIGTLPAGTSYGFSASTATGTTLTMDLPDGADPGFVSFVVQVTETSVVPNRAAVQPIMILVHPSPAGSL